MTDKEKIRAEIEKRYRENKADGYSDVCEELWDILSFIDSMQEEPVSEDLGEYLYELSKQFPEVSFAKLSRIGVRVAKWQKEQMMAKVIDGKVIANGMGNPILHLWDKGRHLIDKKVKVIVIKGD